MKKLCRKNYPADAPHNGDASQQLSTLVGGVVNDTKHLVGRMLTILKFPQSRGARISGANEHGAFLCAAFAPALGDVPDIAVRQPADSHQRHEKQAA